MAWCAVGAFWARSLGCVYNDWVDRDLDAHIPRTCHRPFVHHTPTAWEWGAVWAWTLIGGGLLCWALPWACSALATAGAIGALMYPWLKRITRYPQIGLAVIFNIGVWMPSLIQQVPCRGMLWGLYLYGVFWTIAYDTLYALQDEPWDRGLGIGSLAVVLGADTMPCLLYGLLFVRTIVLGITVGSWTWGVGLFVSQTMVLSCVCRHLTNATVLHRSFHWWASVEGGIVGLVLWLVAS